MAKLVGPELSRQLRDLSLQIYSKAADYARQRGIIIAGLVCGYLLAAWQYHRVAAWFGSFLKLQTVAEIAGFVTRFLGVFSLAGMAGRIARWAVKESGLSFVDRI